MPALSTVSRKPRHSLSRYDLRGAREPANGLGMPPPSRNVATAVVAVPDPFDAEMRIRATVNRRVDLLEDERSHGRISEAAYQVGRLVQVVFERATKPAGAGSQWRMGDRVDAAWSHEFKIVLGLDDARKIQAYLGRIADAVGLIDMRLLRAVLGDRMTFGEYAAVQGQAGDRATAYWARRCRDALEELATRWAGRGRS